MTLPILLIVVGIILAILVHYALGIALIVIGLLLLLVPYFTSRRGARI